MDTVKREFLDSDELLESFRHHLENVRGLSSATVRKYSFVAAQFLHSLAQNGKNLDVSTLSADAISSFVRLDAARRTRRGVRQSVTPMRSFLRFLIMRGTLPKGIDYAVPFIKGQSQAPLPQSLSAAEMRKILGKCTNERDHAILQILARLALRAQEIVQLRLDDIDWRNGSLLVRTPKTHCERLLPLPPEVGEAVLRYLKTGRPETAHQEIFIRALRPFDPLTPSAVTKIAWRAISSAGVDRISARGSHLFRHTLATELVNNGVSFKDVADLLGHQSLETTAIYAKVNLVTLSKVAMEWPGGLA